MNSTLVLKIREIYGNKVSFQFRKETIRMRGCVIEKEKVLKANFRHRWLPTLPTKKPSSKMADKLTPEHSLVLHFKGVSPISD